MFFSSSNKAFTERMVTGDHLETAKHIAKECGILAEDEDPNE